MSAPEEKRYYQYSRYLKELFGQKVYKVTLDAGFSCPNRDGAISSGGCIFCDASGSFSCAHDNKLSIKEQLHIGIENQRKRFGAQKFISYLQAYTNTYGSIEHLEDVYSQALSHEDVVGISIGTRPDCVDESKISLISSYAKDYETWIEYGLQSSNNNTLKFINRGHTVEDFIRAVEMTKNRGIKICAHMILGLPEETKKDALNTARLLASLGVDGVKIHLLCVLKNTKLEQMYNNKEINLLLKDEYVGVVCDFLEELPPSMTIHRLAGNGLKKILVAPRWLSDKFEVLTAIDNELEKRESYQGKNFSSCIPGV